MSQHVRQQIRAAVASLLLPVGNVFATRAYPLAESELPAILVYSGDETIEADMTVLERTMQLVIDVRAQETSALEHVLDDLTAAIEIAIAADPTLGGLVYHCLPASISTSRLTDGAQPVGRALLVFEVHYRTTADDPQTAI